MDGPGGHTACRIPFERRAGGRGRYFRSSREESKMLYWAAVFFIIAIVAAVFGFGGVAAGATSIAQVLFGLFLLIAVVSLILGLVRRH
jgi:uncharacterized membrane protein YtjA (UPF0391 family)